MHHTIRVHHSQRTNLSGFSRLWVDFILNIHALPIAFKKLFQVLLPANEFLACTGTLRSVSDFLFREFVLLVLSQLAQSKCILAGGRLLGLSVLVISFILLLKFGRPCRTAHLPLKHILVVLIRGSSVILVPSSGLLVPISHSPVILKIFTPSCLFRLV